MSTKPGRPAPPQPGRTRALRLALAWAVGVGLLAWLTRRVRWGDLSDTVLPAPAWVWLLAAAGLGASYLFRGLRIHAELSRRHPVTAGQCLRVMVLHNAAVNVVPMRGGDAAYPLLVNRRLGVPMGQAVASLVWIRAQDAFLLGLAVLAFLPGLSPGQKLALAAAALAGVLALIALVQRFVARRAATLRGRLARTAVAALQALSDAPRHGVAGWLYGAGSWMAKLAALALLLSRLAGLGAVDAVAGVLGGELAGILPVQGPAGFGTYEAGVWAGVALHGHAALRVAAPAVAVHLFSLGEAIAAGALAYALARAARPPAGPGDPASPPRAPALPAPSPEDDRA
jgi:uncharacterized membrane protein YbhN (UPF0104 family)